MLKSHLDANQFLIGLDPLFREIDRQINKPHDKYPPHDIIRTSESSYSLVLAVAGFAKEDIEIKVDGYKLTVSANKLKVDSEQTYVYKGISNRSFTREFTLAKDVVVREATQHDGLLTIKLDVIVPEDKKPRLIAIN
jgi:molecular chaperone IbpA